MQCNAIENCKFKQKQNGHTLMVGWEKPVTRYNKNSNKKNNNKYLDCHKECRTYVRCAGDQEWLNARGKKSLSLASLLLRSLALSISTVLLYNDLFQLSVLLTTSVFTIISASCTMIFTKRFRSTYICGSHR